MLKLAKEFIKREAVNTLGHILGGAAICYGFLPFAPLWVLILCMGAAGGLREYIQYLRKHKNGPFGWTKYWDTLGWVLGALLYWLFKSLGLDADGM